MPSYVTPKKNTAFVFYTALTSQANVNLLQVNPTLAAGDVKVEVDGVSLGNITTLATVTPVGGTTVKVSLSAAEMNGDNITIRFSDAAGAEWCDNTITIQTTARQVDDLSYPTYTLPETASVDGVAPTMEQALYMLIQFMTERAISGTTMTVKKVDGTTSLMTFTLNDATNPTSLTRAT